MVLPVAGRRFADLRVVDLWFEGLRSVIFLLLTRLLDSRFSDSRLLASCFGRSLSRGSSGRGASGRGSPGRELLGCRSLASFVHCKNPGETHK